MKTLIRHRPHRPHGPYRPYTPGSRVAQKFARASLRASARASGRVSARAPLSSLPRSTSLPTSLPTPPLSTPSLSIIIPFRNRADTLCACIDSVISSVVSYISSDQKSSSRSGLKSSSKSGSADSVVELILVDNLSTDGSLEIAQSYAQRAQKNRQQMRDDVQDNLPGLQVIVISCETKGAAAARNAGLRIARANHVLFTDSDCVVPKLWVGALETSLRTGAPLVMGPQEARRNDFLSRWITKQASQHIAAARVRAPSGHIDSFDTKNAGINRREVPLFFDEKLAALEDLDFYLAAKIMLGKSFRTQTQTARSQNDQDNPLTFTTPLFVDCPVMHEENPGPRRLLRAIYLRGRMYLRICKKHNLAPSRRAGFPGFGRLLYGAVFYIGYLRELFCSRKL